MNNRQIYRTKTVLQSANSPVNWANSPEALFPLLRASCYTVSAMIIPEIKKLNRKDIFRYLGLQSHSPGMDIREVEKLRLEAQIDRCEKLVLENARVRCVYQILPEEKIAAGFSSGADMPDDAVIVFEGRDIRKLLDGCTEAVLMALTLGSELERILMQEEVRDMSDALVLDVCASAAVEEAADDFERKLSDLLRKEGRYLTNRYSPGYGDLPLSCQRPLLELLNAQRAAGITLTSSGLMVPRKSVTAIMGISGNMKEKTLGGCGRCPLLSKCSYRSHGMRCYE